MQLKKLCEKNNITVKSVSVASKIAILCLFAVRDILNLCRGLLLVPNSNEDMYSGGLSLSTLQFL